MGTHAQIQVKGEEVYIYRHYDGFPDNILPIIERPMKQFYQRRGNDPFYGIANVMKAIANDHRDSFGTFEDYPLRNNGTLDEQIFLNYGISSEPFGHDYSYLIDLEKGKIIVKTYEGKLVQTVDLKEEKLRWTR